MQVLTEFYVLVFNLYKMPPKKQPFSADEENLLSHSVKNRPPLWDVSYSMYRRNDIKEGLWEEVGNLVGVTGNYKFLTIILF